MTISYAADPAQMKAQLDDLTSMMKQLTITKVCGISTTDYASDACPTLQEVEGGNNVECPQAYLKAPVQKPTKVDYQSSNTSDITTPTNDDQRRANTRNNNMVSLPRLSHEDDVQGDTVVEVSLGTSRPPVQPPPPPDIPLTS
ncbi:hypothetical protein VNO80_06284 [Phaseolus coccineus]|uniref:Uncharacterized protein n=1 Tax=Phaseolus coccineus TaxID=3886 RepID=A0AAN9NLU9_PHACN